jgi:phosphoribosylformylglycinamidine synthase
MSKVRRIYVEKKADFAVRAGELKEEISSYIGLNDIEAVRVLIRYDVENVTDATYEKAKTIVFSEPPVDDLYEEKFPVEVGEKAFSVEYLPGQFDQRADSAAQCVKLLNETEEPVIKSATTYVIKGSISDAELKKIEEYVVNPVDSRVASEDKPETLVDTYPEPSDVAVLDGFISMDSLEFKKLYTSLNLAMSYADFLFIKDYFKNDEKRDPSMTEIRMLDTYWSDHCRHTTFLTELKDVKIDDGEYAEPIRTSFEKYKEAHRKLSEGKSGKYISLMDIALAGMKELRREGKLTDMEDTDEINACSIVVPVKEKLPDGSEQTEEWLVFFKNETHNHPTEIEPFGGAATCLGGAIRDPLSGRGYVYQAMRVTGAADPTVPIADTIEGKLPQRKLVTGAAQGYSSYGNQIGLATGLVDEIYHPNYVAKRMEIGAVMGAARRKNVIRMDSEPGDKIILLGGRTGRDGIGGATGSSKSHTTKSIEVCGAEVQKGNAPTERKIQRLFRRPEVTKLIKKCNDFGAGGVSVAIGELADGLHIYLDRVPKKYAGLDGTELAISESQERMALVVAPSDVDTMLSYAAEENLEAVVAAEVTEDPRLVMEWRGKEIVNISRKFLNTNGAHAETSAEVEIPAGDYFKEGYKADEEISGSPCERWLNTLSDLNVCSKRGLSEMFDSSIGAATVTMPFGGKYEETPNQTMIAKLPMDGMDSDTVTMMSYGFDPYIMSWSPYHGAVYSVISSAAKIVASGGDLDKVHFTFQEYFGHPGTDPKRWGKPLAALLGAFEAQMSLGLASIGGKDSMSGTFNDIDVPPTLVSFAVDVSESENVISDEFKKAGNKIVMFDFALDKYELPDYEDFKRTMAGITKLIKDKAIVSAFVAGRFGIVEAVSKMAFGNKLGVKMDKDLDEAEYFKPRFASIVAEVPADRLDEVMKSGLKVTSLGEVSSDSIFELKNGSFTIDEAMKLWRNRLEKVYPTRSGIENVTVPELHYDAKETYSSRVKVAKPRVFIPVFPGTNCEYDAGKAFTKAGAVPETVVFRNRNEEDIKASVNDFAKAINNSQMIMFPGGFSAGDEPDGSAKFIASVMRNPAIADAVAGLLDRDGLILGICNGFQALIKLGLVPYGKITEIGPDSPTLTRNSIGRHVSRSVYTKAVSNKSPWLMKLELGGVYTIPASHGEGRFVANDEWLKKLRENGQIAFQYVDADGHPTMDEDFNPNGSYMAIEGITDPTGHILGKMAHSERIGDHVATNIYGAQDEKIFESGVSYFT